MEDKRSEIVSSLKDATIGVYEKAKASTKPKTEDFIEMAATGGLFEIRSSEIALSRASNEQVKQLARKMIEDHTHISDELNCLLSELDLNDKKPEQISKPQQILIDDLEVSAEEDFDHRYISQQLDIHEATVTLFKNYIELGDIPKLKEFANDNLATLETHLEKVKQLQKQV